VYRAAFELQQAAYRLSRTFPVEERYALTSQLRRASRSVGANICEAWRKRRYQAHFVSKLTDADAELAETQHWMDTASACGYLSQEQHTALSGAGMEIGAMLGSMMRNADRWCLLRP
jgi:four helix bundle protein